MPKRLPCLPGRLPGFDGATGWLNSSPVSPADLRGKVVLDFWTYTCINWLRTLGYVRAWAEKYGDRGLVTVGIHTPEFPFERDVDNVREAAKDLAVEYPTRSTAPTRSGMPSATGTGRPCTSPMPRDESGTTTSARAATRECEQIVQRLLRDAGRDGISDDLVSVSPEGLEAQADWDNLQTPETYLGSQQAENFAGTHDVPASLTLNEWALSGDLGN
jgi:hypothetical protein